MCKSKADYITPSSVSSVVQLCPTLCESMDCSMPGLPVHHQLLELAQTHVHRVGDAIHHLILCYPLLLLPSIFPSIRVFSRESVLCIRWPKYWNFSFSISRSNEYSGLISFSIANKGQSRQSYGFSSSHVWMWELDYKESWAFKNWYFWTVVLEETLESPLDSKEIQSVHPKGN